MEAQFKLGDEVLARRWDGDVWMPIHYGYYDKHGDLGYCHVAYGGHRYKECIPLEGNEDLAGTCKQSPSEAEWNEKLAQQWYGYLQRVEVDCIGKGWQPAHYIRCEAIEGKPIQHQVLVDGTATVHWFLDKSVRPMQN